MCPIFTTAESSYACSSIIRRTAFLTIIAREVAGTQASPVLLHPRPESVHHRPVFWHIMAGVPATQ